MRNLIYVVVMSVASIAFAEPVRVIFDTDMYTDYDDAGALACLHTLADAGECEILATVACTRDAMSVAMCEIINASRGRPDIPVGCTKGMGQSGMDPTHVRIYGETVRRYAKWVKTPNSNDAPDEANGRHLRLTERMSKDEVGAILTRLMCRERRCMPFLTVD